MPESWDFAKEHEFDSLIWIEFELTDLN